MAPEPAQSTNKPPGDVSTGSQAGRAGAFSISLFLFAALMLLPPIVTLIEGEANLFGLPVIYLYLFAIWIAVVPIPDEPPWIRTRSPAFNRPRNTMLP